MPAYVMTDNPRTFKLERLFRDAVLNKNDIYIPRRERQQLLTILEPRVNNLALVYDSYLQIVTAEMNRLISRGEKKPLKFNRDPKTLSFLKKRGQSRDLVADRSLYEDGGRIDMFFGSGGTLYGFSNSDAMRAKDVVAELKSMRLELAGIVGNWFAERSLISGPDFSSYLTTLVDLSKEVSR